MSAQGIRKFAGLLMLIQQHKDELIRMGSDPSVVQTAKGQQDIALGQLCEKAGDAVKEQFTKATMGQWP